MKDLEEKIARAKALLAPAFGAGEDPRTNEQRDADATELLDIGFEVAGSALVNIARIATALETIATNTVQPEMITVAGAMVGDPVGDNTAALENAYFLAGQAFVNGRRAAGEAI